MPTTEADVRALQQPPAQPRRRFTANDEVVSFRTLAFLPAVIFVPTLGAEVALPGTHIGAILGVFFHLAVLFFVSRVPAPMWAKAAGFGWIVIDVAVGVMDVNLVPEQIYMPMRLGGHVSSAVWIVAVSLLSRPKGFRVVGLVTAGMLALYSFVAPDVPQNLLLLPGAGTVVWFVIAGLWHKPDPLGGVQRRGSSSAQTPAGALRSSTPGAV